MSTLLSWTFGKHLSKPTNELTDWRAVNVGGAVLSLYDTLISKCGQGHLVVLGNHCHKWTFRKCPRQWKNATCRSSVHLCRLWKQWNFILHVGPVNLLRNGWLCIFCNTCELLNEDLWGSELSCQNAGSSEIFRHRVRQIIMTHYYSHKLVLFWLKFTPLGPNTTKKCTTSTPANFETQHIHGKVKKHGSLKCRICTGEKCAQLFLLGDKTPPLWVENHTT